MSVMSYSPRRTGNLVGLVALALAILGGLAVAAFVFLPVPVHIGGISILPYVAGSLLLAAFVLAIVGLTRWGQPKATSIVALILSVLIAGAGVAGPNLLLPAREAAFLSAVRAHVHTDSSDAKLVALGTTVCDKVRSGAGGEAFIGLIFLSGLKPEDLGFVGGAAVRHLCPDQADAARKLATIYAPTQGD